jgi:polysaccharide biosynthesis transport protein
METMMTQASEVVPSPQRQSSGVSHARTFAEEGYFAPGGNGTGEDVDYLAIARHLWRKKFVILAIVVGLTGASAAIVFSLPLHYIAHALVVVSNGNEAVWSTANAGTAPVAALPDPEAVQTEVEILQSPMLAAEVVRDLKLENRAEFNPAVAKPHAPSPTAASQLTETVNKFLKRLHVDTKGKSRVIDVGFDSESPTVAAKAVNTLVDAYIANQLAMRTKAAKQQSQWLQDRIDRLQSQTAKDEQAIAEYRAHAGLYSAPGGSPLLLQQLADTSSDLTKAQAQRTVLDDRLRQLNRSLSVSTDSTTDLLGSRVMTTLRTQEANLDEQLALSSQQYGPSYPATRALKAQIATLRAQMRIEARQIAAAVKNDADIARLREERLTERLKMLQQGVAKMNAADVKLAALQRQVEADRLVLNGYLARYKAVGQDVDKAAQRPGSAIVSYAQVPVKPAKPQRPLLIAIAAICSLVGGCGFVLFRNKSDRTFRSLEELESMTGVTGLGLIPKTEAVARSPIGLTRYDSGLPYRESVKAIYTGLFVVPGKKSKTTVITSAHPGEGKTTLALSLAILAAQAGQRTIVVDADFWRAAASKALGREQHTPGLAEVLNGNASLAEALVSDDKSGIDLLPPGKFSRASGLARVENLTELLGVLSTRYDFIIIDSPPVFAVSEALVLAAHADETIVAVRWAKTPRVAVKFALKRLREVGANVVGAALTMVDQHEHALYGFGESAYFSKAVVRYYSRSDAISWSSDSGQQNTKERSSVPQRLAARMMYLASHSDVATDLWTAARRRVLPPKVTPIPQYDRPRQALLVIDVQHAFTTSGGWLSIPTTAAGQLVKAVNDVTRKACDSGLFVAYTQQHLDNGLANIAGRLFLRDKQIKLDDRLDPRLSLVSDHVYLKPRADAFSSDRLDAFLRSRQINHLFLMGIGGATSIARTARSALDRGYGVTFISDGIFTTSEKKWAGMLKEFAAAQAFSITSRDFHELFKPRVSPSGNGNLVVPRLRRKSASANRTRRVVLTDSRTDQPSGI